MAQRNTYKNLTASGAVIAGEGVLSGMYVNNTSSGTMILYSNPSAAANLGPVVSGIITPAIGYHCLGNIHSTAGVYAAIGSTLDVTFHIKDAD